MPPPIANEVIAYEQLIYLGVLSSRVPIVPPFIPVAHVSKSASPLNFSAVFDLPHLRWALRTSILEWSDVKAPTPNPSVLDNIQPDDPTVENFGCWSTKERYHELANYVLPSENVLKLDLSFTRVPDFAYLSPQNQREPFTTFYGLTAAILPDGHAHRDAARPETMPLMQASRLGRRDRPEEQLACFDLLYYVTSGTTQFEFEWKHSPVWYTVGRHMRFVKPLEDLSKEYLKRVFELGVNDEIPPVSSTRLHLMLDAGGDQAF